MSSKNIFFTDKHFVSPRWKSAFPDAEVYFNPSPLPKADNEALIWILSESEGWLDILSFYVKNGCSVVILSRMESLNELRVCLAHGAKGYTDALSNLATLHHIAESVSLGAMWFPGALISSIMQNASKSQLQLSTAQTDPLLSLLSVREREVTEILLTGASNKEIARQLNITERTVKAHLSSIFHKFDVRDRIQLMIVIRGQ